ncbi:MAG: reverse transcriptase domain-containing protein [bacterium]
MNTSSILFEQIYEWDNLWLAYENASRGKRGRPSTAAFEYLLADYLLGLQSELKEKRYHPGSYHSFYIHEPKRRLISAAPFRDRVIHHALCNIIMPYFERLFLADSYANRVGKGMHRALDRCQQFARRYQYVLQCDVVQFFPSIDHILLRNVLGNMLPNEIDLFWLIDLILESGKDVLSEEYRMVYYPGDDLFAVNRARGLPIGNLTSQWWANCYLNPLDQCIKRELSCHGYLRYVDDFLLFSNDKRELWEWREAVIQRLAHYRLTLHEERTYPFPVSEGIPFLGFVVFPEHRRLKRRNLISYRRKLKHILSLGTREQVNSSVRGWINHVRYGDTYGLRRALLSEFDLLALESADV